LQSHLRIAQIGNQPSDLAHAAILARVLIFADRTDGKAHCGAQFFQVFAHLVHGNAALPRRMTAQFKSRLDLFAKDPLQSVW